ncbi:MAG: ROK family protein [Clostridia bacterium]|nr:ROK family protein [Clostridia bacterium]
MNIRQVIKETIKKYINEILEVNNINISQIDGIGIAAPGTCNNKCIIKAENLGIRDFNIVSELKEYYKNIEIKLANDGKCAALCEKEYGSLKKYEDSVFLCLGTGIGGAVFLQNKLLKPNKFSGFELRSCGNRKKWNTMLLWKKGVF